MRGLPGDSESGENPIMPNDRTDPAPWGGCAALGFWHGQLHKCNFRSQKRQLNTNAMHEENMNKTYKRMVVIGFVAIGLACFALKLVLFYYYQGISPQIPNPTNGQIYPLNNHGYIFYVTTNQNLWQDILWYAFFVFAIGGGFLEARWKAIKNIYDELPKKLY
jgi:hypothetical protein